MRNMGLAVAGGALAAVLSSYSLAAAPAAAPPASPAARTAAGPAIVDIQIGDSPDQVMAKLKALDPAFNFTQTGLDIVQGGKHVSAFTWKIEAKSPNQAGKPQDYVAVVLGPDKKVVAVTRTYATPAQPISWSQLIAGLSAKYGKVYPWPADGAPAGGTQAWFFNAGWAPIAAPAGSDKCHFFASPQGSFEHILINEHDPRSMTDAQLGEWTDIEPACSRTLQIASAFRNGDATTTFYATLIDVPAFNKALRDATTLAENADRAEQKRNDAAAQARGAPKF